jgi:hypothetical protein
MEAPALSPDAKRRRIEITPVQPPAITLRCLNPSARHFLQFVIPCKAIPVVDSGPVRFHPRLHFSRSSLGRRSYSRRLLFRLRQRRCRHRCKLAGQSSQHTDVLLVPLGCDTSGIFNWRSYALPPVTCLHVCRLSVSVCRSSACCLIPLLPPSIAQYTVAAATPACTSGTSSTHTLSFIPQCIPSRPLSQISSR